MCECRVPGLGFLWRLGGCAIYTVTLGLVCGDKSYVGMWVPWVLWLAAIT